MLTGIETKIRVGRRLVCIRRSTSVVTDVEVDNGHTSTTN